MVNPVSLKIAVLWGALMLPAWLSAAEKSMPLFFSPDPDVAQAVHESMFGPQGIGKNGPMTKIGQDLATLFFEHREFKKPTGPGVSKQAFQPSNKMLRLKDEKVVVDAVASGDTSELKEELEALGMENTSTYGRFVSGLLPVAALDKASALAEMQLARPAYAKAMAGSVTSQGDMAQVSNIARSTFGVDGSGVVVGTLSDSYNCQGGASADVGTNDLPSGIVVLAEEDGCGSGSDEGRAMMQIIHDVAPGANQAFHTAFDGIASFANGILDLANIAGADIINDDVFYYAEPMFQDGVIAQAIDSVKASGVAYFSSAGNQADQSYEAVFSDSGVRGYYAGSVRHDFDPGPGIDSLMQVSIPKYTQVIFVLQWDDPFFSVSGSPGADTDMNMILYSSSGQAKAGAIADNRGGDAVEIFAYTNGTGTTQTCQIGIDHRFGPPPGKVKFVYFGSMNIDEYATNSATSYGHAMAAGGRSVGAAWYSQTPAYGVSPPLLEGFSSRGGIEILFDTQGNPISDIRQDPDFVAPDGGDTTFFGFDYDENGWKNFFGTSAAAPHAAGVAALLKQLDSTITPDEIYTALESTAIDMGPAGIDYLSGYGLIQADLALATLDADADGVLDATDNCMNVPNPLQENFDGDLLGDACDDDDDDDGLSDTDEAVHGSNPFNTDTDSDNLTDGDEVHTHGTNPILPDTDGDEFNDDVEIVAGSNANDASSIPGEHTGDVNGDELVDAGDLVLLQRIIIGEVAASTNQIIRGDVAPLSAGVPAPDGVLNLADYLVLSRKVLGGVSSF